MRSYGEIQQFNLIGPDEGNTGSYDIVVIKNPFWPGFATFYDHRTKSWSNLYLGNGRKLKQYFIPTRLKDFLKEPKDLFEHAEPNHHEPPKPEGEGEEEEMYDDEIDD